jgi:hypothetical protein
MAIILNGFGSKYAALASGEKLRQQKRRECIE